MLKKCRYLPRLETERLILRELSKEDTEDLREGVLYEKRY